MRKILIYILVAFAYFSCQRKTDSLEHAEKDSNQSITSQKQVEISPPEKVLAGTPMIIPSGEPTTIQTTNKLRHLKITQRIPIREPQVTLLGADSLQAPVKIQALGKRILAGQPQIIMSKDPTTRERNPHSFCTYSSMQGLVSSNALSIVQDTLGNIWIGSYGGGISKFDGTFFTNYSDNEGLPNNLIWRVFFDSKGHLWISTLNQGVSRFDGKYFTQYTTDNGLVSNRIWYIYEDTQGTIWFGSDTGLSKYDGEFFTNYKAEQGLPFESIASIIEDRHGTLWMGCYRGGGIITFDGKKFTHYSKNEGFERTSIPSLLEDKNGDIWLGKYYGGLARYNGKEFIHYDKNICNNQRISSINQDKEGNIWLGTYGDGLVKITGDSFVNYTEKDGLPGEKINNFIFDKNNTIWIANSTVGISKYMGRAFTRLSEEEGIIDETMAILNDHQGMMWIGTHGGGLLQYDGEKTKRYTSNEGLCGDQVQALLIDDDKQLWIATFDNGISKFDGKTFTNYGLQEGLNSEQLLSICHDHHGNIWMGTYSEGIIKFDGNYFTNYNSENGLTNKLIQCLKADPTGNIWAGTYGDGAYLIKGSEITHYTQKDGLCSEVIYSIEIDSDGDIWFGGKENGVSRYDGASFCNYTEENGLSNNTVTAIFEAKNQDLWFGTKTGISRLTMENRKKHCRALQEQSIQKGSNTGSKNEVLFERFNYEDGFFENTCNRGAIEEDDDGSIWFGAKDKAVLLSPSGIIPDSLPPNVLINRIQLFNENIPWSKLYSTPDTSLILDNGIEVSGIRFDDTYHSLELPHKLSLKYNNNFVTIFFSAIAHKQSSAIRYQYKLDGLEQNWSSPTPNKNASYGNLPPGKYSFLVKAMNSSGHWSNAAQYEFTIRPPWWKTMFFRIIAFLIAASTLTGLYFRRINVLKKQQRELQKIIEEKTKLVVRQKEDIERQKDELEVTNNMKDRFFSIIAHDLRSPLGSFLGLSHLMSKELHSLNQDDIKEIAEGMHKSATSLSNLLENLLQWARMQQGLISFEQNTLQLLPIVNEAVGLSYESAKNKEIEIAIDIPEKQHVYTDHNILSMIIRNLLSNAIKFTNKGGKIAIYARAVKGNLVEIVVKDDGIGMNAQQCERLFRIDKSTGRPGTEGEPSAGLGLVLCKDFVEKSGGKLWVKSEENVGSEFYFTLPSKAL